MDTSAPHPITPDAAEDSDAISITLPTLAPGERYAGIVLNPSGLPSHHLILLPQQPDAHLTWPAAMEWAASIGADLPTRQEQALLFANLRDQFTPEWHWSGEQSAGNASSAWYQYFDDGTQDDDAKGYKGRVRAVRRFLTD